MTPSSLHKFSMDTFPSFVSRAKASESISTDVTHVSSSINYYFERVPVNQDDFIEGSLQFHSNFDSGNLCSVDKVISDKPRRVNDPLATFVLRCREDTIPVSFNDNRYIPKESSEWFYFSVQNMPPGEYMFHICGISVKKSCLAKGMQPIIYSEIDKDIGWHRSGTHTAYVHTKHSIFANMKEFKDDRFNEKYIYSFMLTVQHGEDTIFVAHQQPYTYSLLQSTLLNVKGHKYLQHSVLCKSNEGRNCDLLVIQDGLQREEAEGKSKQILFLVGRSKASDCVSSWLMDGFLHFMLSEHAIAKSIRNDFDVYLVPMLNPDGVDAGHKIGNTKGIHLDKMFANPSKKCAPTIYYTKKLIRHLTRSVKFGKIALFCSLKGDSSRMGCYMKGVDDDHVDNMMDESSIDQPSSWDLVCSLMSRTKLMDCRHCKFESKKDIGIRCGYLQRIKRILGQSLCLSFNVSVFRGSASLYRRHLDIKDYLYHAALLAHCIYETLDTERKTNITEHIANMIRSRKEGEELEQDDQDVSLSTRDFVIGEHSSYNWWTKQEDSEHEEKEAGGEYIVTQRLLQDPALQLVTLSLTKGSGRLRNRHMSNVISRAFVMVNRLNLVEEFSDDLSVASVADSVNGMYDEKEEQNVEKSDSKFMIHDSDEESSLYSFNSIYVSSSDGESFAYTTESESEQSDSDNEEDKRDKDYKGKDRDKDKLREAQIAIGTAWGTFVDTDNMDAKFSSLHHRREGFEEIMKKNELLKKKKQSRAEEDYCVTEDFFNEVIARYLISPRGNRANKAPATSPSAPTTPFSARVSRKSKTTTIGRSLVQSDGLHYHSRKFSVSPVREDVMKVKHRFPNFERMIHDNERRWLADHWPSNKKSKNRIGKSKKIDDQLKEVESFLQDIRVENQDLQDLINKTNVTSSTSGVSRTQIKQATREFSINLSSSDVSNRRKDRQKDDDDDDDDDDVGNTPSDLSDATPRIERVTSWANNEDAFLSHEPETPVSKVSFQSPRVTSLLHRLNTTAQSLPANAANARPMMRFASTNTTRRQEPHVMNTIPQSVMKTITKKYHRSRRKDPLKI